MSAMPTLSVVIPTRNRPQVLLKALACIQEGSEHPEEVIIVDDGSDPPLGGSIDSAGYPFALTVLRNAPARGAPAARNRGMRMARGEVVLIIDDDILLDRHAIRYHKALHQRHPEPGYAVSGRVIFDPDMPRTVILDYLEEYGSHAWMARRAEGELFRSGVISANLSMKTVFLRDRPLFDERFPYNRNEDTEFGLRMMRHGMRPRFSYAPSARHHSPLTLQDYLGVLEKSGLCKGFWALHMPDDTDRCFMLERLLRGAGERSRVFDEAGAVMRELGEDFADRAVDDVSVSDRHRFCEIAPRWFAYIEQEFQLRYWRDHVSGFDRIESLLDRNGGPWSAEAFAAAHAVNRGFLPLALVYANYLIDTGRSVEVSGVLEPFDGVWADLTRAHAAVELGDWQSTEALIRRVIDRTEDPTVIAARQRQLAAQRLNGVCDTGHVPAELKSLACRLRDLEPDFAFLGSIAPAEKHLAVEARYEHMREILPHDRPSA